MDLRKGTLRLSLLAAGVFLFAWALGIAGPGLLGSLKPALTGYGFACLLLYPFISIWDVWGWRMAFAPEVRSRVGSTDLFFVRLAGEALNNLTPFLDVGGEYLKVDLCSRRFGLDKKAALVSALLARTVLFLSEILFWLAGLALIFLAPGVPGEWRWILLALCGVFAVLGAAVVWAQHRGLFRKAAGWLERLGLKRELLQKYHVSLSEMDAEVARFYSPEDKRLGAAAFLHFLGWAAGGVEMWLMLRLLGIEVGLMEGIAFEALLQLLRTASFFIPGNLGAQEAGLALAGQWLGWHPGVGVAVSLLKRARQLLWTGIGLAVWAVYEWLGRRR